MFDLNNNKMIQKFHLKINALTSICLQKVLNYQQSQLIICGFPRSGTSLIYNMISSSLPGFRYENFEEYFIFRIHKLGNWGSKAPMDVFHIKHIDDLNINKKKLIILILVRDVRDIITSRHPIYPNEYFIGYDHSWWPQNDDFSEWSYDAPGVMEIHKAVKLSVHRPDVLLIKYEDLVNNPNKIQEKISEKYNLLFNGMFSDFHSKPDKHAYRYEGKFSPNAYDLVLENKKSRTDRIARWKNNDTDIKRVKKQFTDCPELFAILEYYGYEKTKQWYFDIE